MATAIRARGLAEGVPLVALTAHSGDANRTRSFDAGLDDHMVKPLRRGDLADLLYKWLDSRSHSKPQLDQGLVAL